MSAVPNLPTLSVTVITFNEERDIEACLRSVSWADEILVVDSLSTDRTREIATRCGARVIEHAFPGFSAQRNFAAGESSGEWILQLDADERVPPPLADEIRRTVADPASADLYLVARRNLWLGRWIRHGGWYPDYAPRLFRKGKGEWVGYTHEQFVVRGSTGTLRNDLIHDNLRSVHEHLQKQLISTTQEVRDAAERGLRFCWLPPRAVAVETLRRVLHRPRLLTVRVAYKELVKNRIELVWLVPFAPFLRFLYMYVIRLGFLDGAAGFWVAALSAVYTAMRYAKLWEFARMREAAGGQGGAVPSNEAMQEMYRRWWPSG